MRNCGDEITNPNFRADLYYSKTQFVTVDRCPIRMLPKDFSRYNLYPKMAKIYRIPPSEVDSLPSRTIDFLLASSAGESVAYERREINQKAKKAAQDALKQQSGRKGTQGPRKGKR